MTLRLVLLGDSIASGTGAARAADALAPRLAAALCATGTPTESACVAVPGARSADLAVQVERAAPWRPDVAVVVVGANDLTRQVPPAQAAADLGRAVRGLRALGAQVVVVPAPDLSVLAHVPPAARGLVRAASALLRGAQARAVLAEGGRVADLGGRTTAAFASDPSLFSADRFHPSSAGYAVIAEALLPAVRAAAGAATADADGTRSA
ncbi:SGNH/GDSL hydrolase family protein [Quadrisphaera sp. DSM 44207]|uniref:SGNH/GDSL hydrolase family protein n=1 Tax=Quadrisphaera sp. DSM 44207 TaxID=1881057 RepID=UPI000B864B13|nr:SGNH/GDSL hydrolase family protein [Quadrisphaera sp. DSM 44207]